jgi:hypothetical protein
MSTKPAAALSANLVAVKGAAVPSPDMPGRGAPVAAVTPEMPERPQPAPVAAVPDEKSETGGQPLNFRVSEAFRRQFKVYAAEHGLKLNELLRLSFEAYRRGKGD